MLPVLSIYIVTHNGKLKSFVCVFQNVDQLIFKFKDLLGKGSALEIRQRYSELQRVEAYGFRKYQVNDNRLTFQAKTVNKQEGFKLNYLKTGSGRMI